jgi:HEAT repeat protein
MKRTMIFGLALGAAFLTTPSVQAQKDFLNKGVASWIKNLDKDAKEVDRRSAAFALGKMGSDAVDAVPALKRIAGQDPSPKVREAAVFALGEIARESIKAAGDPQLAPLFVKSLKDDAWPVRRSAAFALGCLGQDCVAAQEPLEAALRDSYPEVRQNAAWALGRIGQPAIPKLREALRDTDPFVRRDAAQSLYQVAEPEPIRVALDEFLNLCRDDNSEVRRATVTVLIRIVGPEDAKTAAAPLRGVLTDGDEEIRTNAALALANIGGKEAAAAVPVLVTALHRGDIELRRQAAAALRNIGPDAARAVPDLIKTLKDPDAELRHNTAVALGGIGAPAEKAVPALVEMLIDRKEVQEPRMAAAGALSRIGAVPAAIDALPRLLQLISNADDDADVRWRTVWALRPHNVSLQKVPGVYPALTKVLKEPKTEANRMLRHDCAYMVGVLQGKDVPNEVLDALVDFLHDSKVQIYVRTDANLQATGAEIVSGKAKVTETGKGDGRVMATQALRQIGAAKVRQRPEIIRQLQTLAADPNTFVELRQDCAKLLKELR